MLKRSHMCGSLRASHVGQTVTVCGWINTCRDQSKGLIFTDLRDREGLCQVVFNLEDSPAELIALARTLRREFVIAVTGLVRVRAGGANPKLATGEIEVVAQKLELLNAAETPPRPFFESASASLNTANSVLPAISLTSVSSSP